MKTTAWILAVAVCGALVYTGAAGAETATSGCQSAGYSIDSRGSGYCVDSNGRDTLGAQR